MAWSLVRGICTCLVRDHGLHGLLYYEPPLRQVWDMASHQRIASFKRPASSLKGDAFKPHLFWEGEQLLYIGWGCSMRVGQRLSRQNLICCMHFCRPCICAKNF
jgi:hypothetical protein